MVLDKFTRSIKIVDWDPGYYPDIKEATKAQKMCYEQLVKAIEQGHYVDIGKNESYLYYYVRELSSSLYEAYVDKCVPTLEARCRRFFELYNETNPKPVSYLDMWIVLLSCVQNKPLNELMSDLDKYLEFHQKHGYGCARDLMLTIFVHSNRITPRTKVDPKYFMSFSHINPKSLLTTTGKKYYNEVAKYIMKILSADFDRTGINFLYKLYDFVPGGICIRGEEISCLEPEELEKIGHEFDQYNILGLQISYDAPKPMKIFDLRIPCNEDAVEHTTFIKTVVREAENAFRQDRGLKPVGEGWVSESLLFRQIKAMLPGTRVLQHSSPSFLGKQHYDVYIPKYKIAFEYQGDQHYKAIGLFGGEEGLIATQERDQRKKKLSYENGVVLCEVLPGYEIKEVADALYEVILENFPDAPLLDKEEAISLATAALPISSNTRSKVEYSETVDKVSQSIAKERKLDTLLNKEMSRLLSSLQPSRLSQKDINALSHEEMEIFLNKFSEIKLLSKKHPNVAITETMAIMEDGYTAPAAYLELAKNYRKLNKSKSALFVLLQGKKDFGYNFDDKIKALIKKLDDDLL